MAALLFLAPLLLLGTAADPAPAETEGCPWLGNATGGNFSVEMTPARYLVNTTYLVVIKDDRNHSESPGQYLLQALSPLNGSVGRWEGAPTQNCSSLDTATLNVTQDTARWTSPSRNLSSVQIRVYLSLPENITELQTLVLYRGPESTTSPSISTPNSVGRAGSSSLVLAVLPLPLLLLTGSLLS